MQAYILDIAKIYKIFESSDNFYKDATYVSTKEFYQLLIVMEYNSVLDIEILCCYILMNTKFQTSYEIVMI